MSKFNVGDKVRVVRRPSRHFGKVGEVQSIRAAISSTEGYLNRTLLETGESLNFYDRNLELIAASEAERPPMFSRQVAQPVAPTPWSRSGGIVTDATGRIVFETDTPEVAEEIKKIVETHMARPKEEPTKAPAQFFSDGHITPDVYRLDADGTWTFQAYPYDAPIVREPQSSDWENIRPIRVHELDHGYFVKDQEAAK